MKYLRFISILLAILACTFLSTLLLAHPSVATAAPDPFGKISPSNNSSVFTSTVTLQWEASATPGVTYEYCVFTKQSCPPGQYRPAGTKTSITVSLKPSSTYYWQVRARATDGTYTYANNNTPWRFTTGTAAPSAFNKFSPTSGSSNQATSVTLTWTTSNGMNVNYQVCYDTTNNNTCESNIWLMAGTALSYTLNGLNYNTTYYWQVRAYNSKGTVYANGSASSFWNFRTRIAPPTPFFKLAPADGSDSMPTDVSLTWTASTGTNLTYQYCIDETDDDICNTDWVSTDTNTYAAPTGLSYNKTYYWQARALNNNLTTDSLEADNGDWFVFNTLLEEPSSFIKLLPYNEATDVSLTPYLYWSSSEGTGITYEYCLVVYTNPCTNWTPTSGSNTFVRISTPLQNNTNYIWQVRSKDAGATIVYADGGEWNFTTLPEPPAWNPEVFSTPEDPLTPYTGQLSATNPGDKTLIYTLSGRAPAGTFLLASNGSFTFTPEANFNGVVSFSFLIWDGVNNPAGPYTATIDVTPVNDPPVILPIENVSVFTGSDIFFTIFTSDADLTYGDTLTLQLIGTLPSGATFTISQDATTHAVSGDFDWLGATWLNTHPGPYTFTARVTDGGGLGVSTEATFTVTINPYISYLPNIAR